MATPALQAEVTSLAGLTPALRAEAAEQETEQASRVSSQSAENHPTAADDCRAAGAIQTPCQNRNPGPNRGL